MKNKIAQIFKNYFSEQDSPFNIAIFRIIFYYFVLARLNTKEILWFSQLPAELKSPPIGWHFLLTLIPINLDLAFKGLVLFKFFCFLAMIGCFARISSFLAALLGIYVLGIPEFYGKVDHYHHLIWFMLIFSACRCADVLSIDSIWKAFWKGRPGIVLNNLKSNEYALPLRYMWLLMGVLYFFPGFWKIVWTNGHWFFSDDLKYIFYKRWFMLHGWVPFFRIDHYPFLYKCCGLAVVFFEVTFIILILFPMLRIVAMLSGLLFHNFTYVFMRISFYSLQICYVSLINWAEILNRWGRFLFKEPLYVIYLGNAKNTHSIMALLSNFDIFQRIIYVNASNFETCPIDLRWISPDDLARKMHVVVGQKKWTGFEAYGKLVARIPFLWPIFPVILLFFVTRIGKNTYYQVSDASLSESRSSPDHITSVLRKDFLGNQILNFMGSSLLVINIVLGFGRITSWPFSCYPTFASRHYMASIETITPYEIIGKDEIPINLNALDDYLDVSKFKGMIDSILNMRGCNQEKRLKALVSLMKENGMISNKLSRIRFYKTTNSTIPENFSHSIISRKLLIEINR